VNTHPSVISKIIRRLYNRETVSYVIFGALTSIVNIGVFEFFFLTGSDYRTANLIALITAKLFAYVVNKLFVFRTKTGSVGALLREFGLFTLARGSTMILDWVGLILLVSMLGLSEHVGKLIITVIVVILNYVFGKFLVFKKIPAGDQGMDSAEHR
jgi:putative flippase GtrA